MHYNVNRKQPNITNGASQTKPDGYLPREMIAKDHNEREEEKEDKGRVKSEESEVYKMMLDTKIVQK